MDGGCPLRGGRYSSSEYVADEIWYGEQVADAGEDTSIAGTAGNLCYRWATAIA